MIVKIELKKKKKTCTFLNVVVIVCGGIYSVMVTVIVLQVEAV